MLPYILLVGGIIGAFCAGMLTYDKIELLKNPSAHLECNLNPIIACGSVINTPQASAFGFPNTFIGLVGFAIVTCVGAGIVASATYKRWFWLSLEAGLAFAAGFVTWLQFETIYRIGALCPYCMVTWAVTIPLFWYTTLYNIQAGNIRLPNRASAVGSFIQKHHADVLVLWFLIILAAILTHFWYYWRTLF